MGAKADQYANDAKANVNKMDAKVDAKLHEMRSEASKELDKAAKNTEGNLNKAVDQFDKRVSEVSRDSS